MLEDELLLEAKGEGVYTSKRIQRNVAEMHMDENNSCANINDKSITIYGIHNTLTL